MTIIIFKKLSLTEAKRGIKQIEQWFQDNPKRRICRTDTFEVRRGRVIEDILEHTEPKAVETIKKYNNNEI